jgi:outer membrane biosynthesis protein TonB
MINRILVPKNATLGEGALALGTRRKTPLDTRTVVAADLPAMQIDARSNIPAYMPLDVLSARLIIPRDMPVHALDVGNAIPSHVPLQVLGKHIAVPKDAVLPQAPAVRQPVQHAAEMPEVLEPDVITTGEVNFMTGPPRSLRDEAKWVLRGASAVLHAAALLILLMIPSLFTPRQPTQSEILAASHSLGDLYMPPDLRSALRPAPHIDPKANQIHIDPKVIRQLAPPEPKHVLAPEVMAPVISHEQPKENAITAPTLPSAPLPQPVKPQPQLEPIKTDQPSASHGLILPNTSISHTLSQAASDAAQPGAGAGSGLIKMGRMPGARGGGYGGGGGGGGQAAGALSMLGDTHGVDFSSYNARLVASVYRNWTAIMPESALMGDQGIVQLRFRIFKDGTVVAEEPILERSSSKTPLDRAAMGSVRASSPFEPLPAAFSDPYMTYIFTYYYNLEPPRGR